MHEYRLFDHDMIRVTQGFTYESMCILSKIWVGGIWCFTCAAKEESIFRSLWVDWFEIWVIKFITWSYAHAIFMYIGSQFTFAYFWAIFFYNNHFFWSEMNFLNLHG